MENPNEIIMAKLVAIENLLRRLSGIAIPLPANAKEIDEIFEY